MRGHSSLRLVLRHVAKAKIQAWMTRLKPLVSRGVRIRSGLGAQVSRTFRAQNLGSFRTMASDRISGSLPAQLKTETLDVRTPGLTAWFKLMKEP